MAEENPLNRLPDVSEIPSEVPVFVPWRLFSFSLVLMVAIFIINFGLSSFLIPSLQTKVSDRDQQIGALRKEVEQTDKEGINRFYSKIFNLQKILDNHLAAKSYFDFLDKKTINAVKYTAVKISLAEKRIILSAQANSFANAAAQLAVFEAADELASVELKGIKQDQSGVEFNFDLSFNE